MLKEVSSIQIQGKVFSSKTMLPIFGPASGKQTKVALIYGRNGAGKSTIAKAFRKLKGEDIASLSMAEGLDVDSRNVSLEQKDTDSIFIYDEDYVTANVRIEGRGLGSIVMLGEQANLTTQIEQAEMELKEAEKTVEKTGAPLKIFETVSDPKSPKYYIRKMRETLRGENGWAKRDSIARGNRQNSPVNNDTYKKFITLSPTLSRDDLAVLFDEKKKELEKAKGGTEKIDLGVPVVPDVYLNYSIDFGNQLLKTKIERPELSAREKHLLSLVTSGKAQELQERMDYLDKDEIDYCPYCLQDLTAEYKGGLIAKIQRILTDEVKNHQDCLKDLMTEKIIIDLSAFSSLSSYQKCADLLSTINEVIEANNQLLQLKSDNPYSAIADMELNSIKDNSKQLTNALRKLEEERIAHNNKAIDTKPIESALVSINNQMAYYDVINDFVQLDLQQKEMEKAQDLYEKAVKERNEKKIILEDLDVKRKQITIAVDIINNGLKYIFFAENRLSIEPDGEYYKLLSNGSPVLPKDVSVGERNIIGLCYFFTSILSGKNKKTAYNDEYLIVIDDPVSSYDYENKIGILSFLKYKLGQFLEGHPDTRVAVMTHDLMAYFDLEKMCGELSKSWNSVFHSNKSHYRLFELKNCALNDFKYKRRHEYTELIKLVYDYGSGNAGEYDLIIGNIMRQTLEAFSSFVYRQGIEEVSTDEAIIGGMGDEHKAYFKNLMYRIVLNSGSHREEQTRSMDIDFFSVISEEEKRRTAKEILCFIYLLNPQHLLAHIGNDYCDVSSTLNAWCGEIKARSAVI